MMSERPIFTYQARPVLDAAHTAVLDAYAQLYGRAERSLFAAMQAGGTLNDLKRVFQPKFGITARQFNALRVGLEGKIDAIKARRPELIAELQSRIKTAAKVVAKLGLKPSAAAKLHQKKRRLHILQTRLASLQADQKAGAVRLCFGSKRLFNAQYDLAANDYANHEEWKADWQASRSSQIFVLGSQDETAGNQSCQAAVAADGTLSLQLRLPDAMQAQGKHLAITGVRFAYGIEAITAALASSQRVASTTKTGKPTVKRIGSALSWRFVRDDKGWRVFVSCEVAPAVHTTTSSTLGAVGVDMNADHLAVCETDRFGNLTGARRIDVVTYGKTPDQAKAAIGDAAVSIASQARAAGKPIVIEALNFQKKKAELEAADPKQARLLSSFACNKVASSIKAAALRHGVQVIEVNPAYTSVIGAVNSARQRGISTHQGAAYAIARRGLGLSERPTVREAIVPTRSGGHVTFALPARTRAKHVWSFWSKVRTSLKAAHAAHLRCSADKSAEPPLSPARPGLSPIRSSTARFRGANRSQHCSGNVWPDVPF